MRREVSTLVINEAGDVGDTRTILLTWGKESEGEGGSPGMKLNNGKGG